ncbi:MAG TPA: DnaB-like helicase N-terminal domain-containing protein, partial [Chitinophagaceae bacterium]|nr:DnaB-like helicase N-terminal domain-containing protein [Chitinophagaceae bacterium]
MDLTKDRQRRKTGLLDLGTMMYGKVPPQAKDIEEAILGAIMVEKDAIDNVNDILSPESFYVDGHKRIFESMLSLQQKHSPIDVLTVVEELKSREELDLVGGPFIITKLTNNVVSGANIVAHARIVKQKFIQRELIRVAGEIIGDAYEDSSDAFELLDEAESRILEIGSNVESGMISIENVLIKAMDKVEEWAKNDSTITGVSSGFPELDKATRGWQGGDLILLGARPSV